MRKIFIAVAMLAALTFSAVPSQALIGMPDATLGCDLTMPFFLVGIAPYSNVNTLLVLWDVGGVGISLHYTVLTKRSVSVYNDVLKGTKYDLVSTDAKTIVDKMAPVYKNQLKIDLDGDGTADHYAGYIEFINDFAANHLAGEIMLVDIAKGMASGVIAPMREYYDALFACAQQQNPVWGHEAFSANALASSLSLELGGGCQNAFAFGLFPKYYINDANGKTYWFFWKSDNGPGTLHIYWFDEAENYVSSNIPLPDELDIIDVEPYLPVILHSGYPKEGFVLVVTPDVNGVGFVGSRQWLGYTWLRAVGTAQESWSTLVEMFRDAAW